MDSDTSKAGVKTYGYLFSDPQPNNPAYSGVGHGDEVVYVYGAVKALNGTAAAQLLSAQMINYWVSFATSLDPNDGLGTTRPKWSQYTMKNQVLIELNSLNTTLIPDTYRAKQIAYINSDPLLWHHRRGL